MTWMCSSSSSSSRTCILLYHYLYMRICMSLLCKIFATLTAFTLYCRDRESRDMAFVERFSIHEILPHVINCTRELYRDEYHSQTDQWIFITNEALYYILPVILTIGVIFSVINTIVSAKMAVDSHDCYLAAFNLSCFLLLTITCASQLPNYVRQTGSDSTYNLILPYLPAVTNWFWYASTWLIITVVIERTAHSLCGKWHASFNKIHGALVSVVIVMISFVSTLPQYWEYALGEVLDSHGDHNCSRNVLVPRPEVLQEDGLSYVVEYDWFHWYEMIISIGLPYLLLPMLLPPLLCVRMHIYTSMPSSIGKAGSMKYRAGYNMKDQLREERSFNRLLVTISLLYIVMSAPRNALRLFQNPPISMVLSDNDLLMATLQVMFDVLFYLFFSILFFFYLAFGTKFRTTLYQLCCCKKQDPYDYY